MQVPEFVPMYIIVGIVVRVSKRTGNNFLRNEALNVLFLSPFPALHCCGGHQM
jgi:hypothetical protein